MLYVGVSTSIDGKCSSDVFKILVLRGRLETCHVALVDVDEEDVEARRWWLQHARDGMDYYGCGMTMEACK